MSKWFSEDPRTHEWTPYDKADSAALEKSWNGKKDPVQLDFCGTTFTVDLKKMTQANSGGGSRKVRRDAAAAASSKVQQFVQKMCPEGTLDLEGIVALCEAFQIDPATSAPFVLFYKLGAEGPWQITAEELSSGLAGHSLEPTAKDVGAKIKQWTTDLGTNYEDFSKFYEFVFKFIRPSTSAKAIAFDDVKEPMTVALKVHKKYTFGTPDRLLAFLASKAKVVSFDLWKQTLRFLHDIKPDCSNYSEDDVWNSLLDDFVETAKK
jgi:hypothetical protein